MSATQRFRHVSPHNGRWTFQLSILGFPCRTSEHFDTAEDAALSADLTKHYLAVTFKLVLSSSLDGDVFSNEAYSRRGVILSDPTSVLKSIPADVREFIESHRAGLNRHRDAQPEETTYAKISRHGPSMKIPAVREWVVACEKAASEVESFSAINQTYFSAVLGAVGVRAADILKPVSLVIKMLDGVTSPRLVERKTRLLELQAHLQATSEHIKFLTAQFESESDAVFSALANLEAARPALV